MHDQSTISGIKAEIDRGTEAVRLGDAAQASVQFANALFLAEELGDERLRRDQLIELAALMERYGFPALSLLAVERAVVLDARLGLEGPIADDLCALGTAHLRLDQREAAQRWYREALEAFLRGGRFASAAAASTSLALIVAERGDGPKAISLLEESLAYLGREPSEQVEIQTRCALLQVLELTQEDSARAIENAKRVCSQLLRRMPEYQREISRRFIDRAIERYLKARPALDPARWRLEHFPEL